MKKISKLEIPFIAALCITISGCFASNGFNSLQKPVSGVATATTTTTTETTSTPALGSGEFAWAKSLGDPAASLNNGKGVAVDSSGNVYIAGHFRGTTDFDPSGAVANLTSAGVDDIFVAKYSASGAYQWAFRIGDTSADFGLGIVVDSSSNIYVTGSFQGTVDFDPGAGTANATSAGDEDIFFAKYDSSGNYIWAKKIGDTGYDRGAGIAIDSTGSNILITGTYTGTVDFDAGAGTANQVGNGGNESFILKYDASGNYTWSISLSSISTDEGKGIAVDSSGNVYVTGYISWTTDFDPSGGTTNLAGFNPDTYVAKYSSAGALTWAIKIGTAMVANDQGNSIAVDSAGNVYVAGSFGGTADFDWTGGSLLRTAAGNSDMYLAKYDSTGFVVWAYAFGAGLENFGSAVVVDSSDNVYVAGNYDTGTIDFDPGAGTTNLTCAIWICGVMLKFASTGALTWAKSLDLNLISTSGGGVYSVAVDTSGSVYSTGGYQNTTDFDPGAGTSNLTVAAGDFSGAYDAFILKLY